jgi:type IV pilus assembly protein PilO
MNTAVKKKKIDARDLLDGVAAQFKNLDPKDPSVWPNLPKWLLALAIAALTAFGAWYVYLSGFEEELVAEQQKEVKLRSDYESKLLKAVSLEGLKKQREQVQQYVIQLEKQLPSKSEMAALLSDINQAGLGRSLQFELFKPGSEDIKDYYAELPITVRVSGQFHDMGAFVSDIAHLSRIVTLNNIVMAPKNKSIDGALQFDATVKTYRYLDAEELQARQVAATKKGRK